MLWYAIFGLTRDPVRCRRHKQAVNGLAMLGPPGCEAEAREMWTCGDDGLLVRWRRHAKEVCWPGPRGLSSS